MRCMTDINTTAESARENARRASGQFGEQQHSAPESQLRDPRTPLTVITTVMLPKPEHVPYPTELPTGGKVSADFEDTGGVFVSIEWDDHFDVNGDNVRLALGGDSGYGTDWDSLANDEPGFEDATLNDHALSYLRELHGRIDSDAEALRYTATQPHMDAFVARATQPAPEEDHSDEAYLAAAQKRGEQLVGVFADAGNELEDNIADSIADILSYAKAQGLDINELARRGVFYNEED